MAKTREQKETALQTLIDQLKKAKSVVFANFQGLRVKDTDELRAKCRAERLTYVVTKKTLVRRALTTVGQELDTKTLSGGVAVLCADDEVAAAKIMAEFGKTHEVAKIFGGLLEGVLVDAEKILALSKVPGKQELLARLVGAINAPVSGFVNVLAGNLRGLVTVLHAIKEKKPVSAVIRNS